MHASGYTHYFLRGHNITLDCRLTDFDTVEAKDSDGARTRDIEESVKALKEYAQAVQKLFPVDTGKIGPKSIAKAFMTTYESTSISSRREPT